MSNFINEEYYSVITSPTGRFPAVCLAYAGIRMCMPDYDQVRDSIAATGLNDSRKVLVETDIRLVIQLTCQVTGCAANGLLRMTRNENGRPVESVLKLHNPVNKNVCKRGNVIPPEDL